MPGIDVAAAVGAAMVAASGVVVATSDSPKVQSSTFQDATLGHSVCV